MSQGCRVRVRALISGWLDRCPVREFGDWTGDDSEAPTAEEQCVQPRLFKLAMRKRVNELIGKPAPQRECDDTDVGWQAVEAELP